MKKESDAKGTNPTKDVRSRAWMLTLPADEYEQSYVEEQLDGLSFIGQLERGSQSTEKNSVGYEHWQVFVCNDNPVRFSALKRRFPKGHFEAGERSQKGVSYVMKKETSLGIHIQGGDFETSTKLQGRRSDLRKYRNAILTEGKSAHELILTDERAVEYASWLDRLQAERDEELASVRRDDLKVYYLSGPTRTGKTRYVLDNAKERTYRITDYSHPFDAYQNQPILIIDEFRSQLALETMLDLLDVYPVQLGARYRNRWAMWHEVWIVSNWLPERQYRAAPQCDRDAFFARIHRFFEMNADYSLKDTTSKHKLSQEDIDEFEREFVKPLDREEIDR